MSRSWGRQVDGSDRRRRLAPVVGVGVLALLAAACGSTVHGSQGTSAGGSNVTSGGSGQLSTGSGSGSGSGLGAVPGASGSGGTSTTAPGGAGLALPGGSSTGGGSSSGGSSLGGTSSGGGSSSGGSSLGGTSSGGGSSSGGGTSLGVGVASPGSGTSSGGGTSSSGGGTSSSGGGKSSSGGGTSSSGGSHVTTPAGKGVTYGVGVNASTINIGIPYSSNASAANAALGAGGAQQGDTRAQAQAVINYVNAHGGVDGRKLNPVFFNINAFSTESADAQYQAICAAFTQDNKVLVGLAGGDDSYNACMQKGGAVIVDNGTSSLYDPAEYTRFPDLVSTATFDLDRQADSMVTSWAAGGYFADKGAHYGFITFDYPSFHEAATRITSDLGQHGVHPDTEFVPLPQTYGDYSSFVAAINTAALKFKGEGVDHVMILDAAGNIALFFTQRAQAQQYHPRYGLGAQSFNTDLSSTLGPTAAQPQLHGAISNGFLPEADVDYSTYKPDAAAQKCLTILAAGGQTFSNQNAEGVGLSECEGILFIQAAGNLMGNNLTQSGFMAAVNRLGSSFSSPMSIGESFGPSKHEGGTDVQTMKYVDACNCFQYIGSPFAVPLAQ